MRALDGRIELRSRLGKGGMATVYEAYDLREHRHCALKVLDRKYDRGFGIVRFKREYRAAVRLDHPCCVRVFEQGQAGDAHFYTMELVPGNSLRRHASRFDGGGRLPRFEALPVAEAVRIALQVASALDYIHARHIIHRDLKPDNILVGADGCVKLADFGVAQVADLAEERATGSVIGSPRYLAPEVIGEGVTDPRSDLYALGVILYELLAGVHPLRDAFSPGSDWPRKVVETPAVPLTQVAPDVPEKLADVVMRLLAKDPKARPRTAAQVFGALADGFDRRSVPALPVLPPLAGHPYLAAPPLVGREQALAAGFAFLERALGPGLGGTPVLLAISGVGGCGKSRLLGRLLKKAEAAGAVVLSVECREQAGAPLSELLDVLRVLGAGPDADAPRDETVPSSIEGKPDREMETTALVVVGDRPDAPQVTPALPSAASSPEIAEASDLSVRRLLEVAGSRPVLVSVEDLQWIGDASLQVLTAWVRAAAITRRQGKAAPIALVVTHRPAPLDGLFDAARELSALERLDLVPLEPEGTLDLVSALLGQAADDAAKRFSDRMFSGRECTPLFVRQIMQILLGRGLLHDPRVRWNGEWRLVPEALEGVELPVTLQQAIGDVAARLSVETQEMLAVAATSGRRFAVSELGHALHKHEALLRDCLDEAERTGLIVQNSAEEGHYLFAHDRYRESIYALSSEFVRRRNHAGWARALLSVQGESPRLLPELAHHFAEAREYERAYHYAGRAGDAALSASAFNQAVDMYRRARAAADAARLNVDPGLIERHGDACVNAGLYREGADAYGERLSRCSETERIAVLLKLAELKYRGAKEQALAPGDVLASLDDVLRAMGFEPPHSAFGYKVRALGNTVEVLSYTIVPSLVRSRPLPGSERLEALCRACSLAVEVAYFFKPRVSAYYGLKATTLAARIGPSAASALAFSAGSAHMSQLGLHAAARRFSSFAVASMPASALAPDRAYVHLLLALSSYCRGELDEARARLETGSALIERSAEPVRRAMLFSVRAQLHVHRGQLSQARVLGRKMIEHGELAGMAYLSFSGCISLGAVSYYEGEFDESIAWLDRALSIEEAFGDEFTRLATLLQRQAAGTERVGAGRADFEQLKKTMALWQSAAFTSVTMSFLLHGAASSVHFALRSGGVDRAFTRWLEDTCRRERRVATNSLQQKSLYLAVLGALAALTRRPSRAGRLFREARHDAERYGVRGERLVIDRLERALGDCGYLQAPR